MEFAVILTPARQILITPAGVNQDPTVIGHMKRKQTTITEMK